MPTYDYICAANGRVLEVRHAMSERLQTWAELCERAGAAAGDTPPDSPVERLATGGQVVNSASLGDAQPPCAQGPCCGGGGCGFGD